MGKKEYIFWKVVGGIMEDNKWLLIVGIVCILAGIIGLFT